MAPDACFLTIKLRASLFLLLWKTTRKALRGVSSPVAGYDIERSSNSRQRPTARTEIFGHGARTSRILPSGLGGKTPREDSLSAIT